MRYDFTVANTSNVPSENYYWHDRIPADVGGKYQGTWQTGQATWVTLIRKLTNTVVPTLPKTGY